MRFIRIRSDAVINKVLPIHRGYFSSREIPGSNPGMEFFAKLENYGSFDLFTNQNNNIKISSLITYSALAWVQLNAIYSVELIHTLDQML